MKILGFCMAIACVYSLGFATEYTNNESEIEQLRIENETLRRSFYVSLDERVKAAVSRNGYVEVRCGE